MLRNNNHKTYRSRPEIIAEILNSLPARRTRVMYNAELSFTELKSYISDLEKFELMRYQDNDSRYYLTVRGHRYLQIYRRLKSELTEQ